MKPLLKISLVLCCAGILFGSITVFAQAQGNFALLEHAITGGGVTQSHGGGFTLAGTYWPDW